MLLRGFSKARYFPRHRKQSIIAVRSRLPIIIDHANVKKMDAHVCTVEWCENGTGKRLLMMIVE